MNKKLKLAALALCLSPSAMAQESDSLAIDSNGDEQAFTFSEAQLGEDDDMSQNVTIIHSNNNIYASQVGYLFSPMRFRYRAFNQKYNEVYINGVEMNDLESGQFRYTLVGGLNRQTNTSRENTLPFENNHYGMAAMGGSTNYNFRPSNFSTGHYVSLSGANRNYTLRGMYSYNSGVLASGWAFSGALTYRWAEQGYVEGTFYNSLSYFFGAEKYLNDRHHLSFLTWGNPTERAAQGASTDEMYWLANDRYYNPYWGYQDGKVRSSRVVNDFQPTALITWDWKISDRTKLVTSLTGRYSIYKGTKLNYDGENPQPDYWKNMPSSYYDVWDESDIYNRTEADKANWLTAKNYMSGYKRDRQINFDRLYLANKNATENGKNAMYYIEAKNINNLNIALASNISHELNKYAALNAGLQLATNKGMHFKTMEDLLGAGRFTNVNTYALGTYPAEDPRVQYDVNNPNAIVKEGDRFAYDYNIFVDKALLWATYKYDRNRLHSFVSGRIAGVEMQREGKMRNGICPDNSYGKGKTAKFLEGGVKAGGSFNLGWGNVVTLGVGYEQKAPQASTAFVSPEMSNDFVVDLKNEKILSAEVGYQLQTSWLKANVNAYYSVMKDVTEWQNFFFDDINSFSYVSMTGIDKSFYGVEWGVNVKITNEFSVKTIGSISEAKNTNNAHVWYISSKYGTFNDANNHQPEMVLNKNMREAGTPLTALSLVLSYHQNGWFIDLNGNYYDRIYLSYSPSARYESTVKLNGGFDPTTKKLIADLSQEKGKGGFMLDASIGKNLRLRHGRSLRINLGIVNLLNNQDIVSGGYEQGRSDYSVNNDGTKNKDRVYKFSKNPKKYYAYGINGMLNVAYLF